VENLEEIKKDLEEVKETVEIIQADVRQNHGLLSGAWNRSIGNKWFGWMFVLITQVIQIILLIIIVFLNL